MEFAFIIIRDNIESEGGERLKKEVVQPNAKVVQPETETSI